MSSVQLLDKTRKIGKLLHNNNSSKVVFNDICKVIRDIVNSNVLVISKKGKVLGVGICDGVEELKELVEDNVGGFIDPMLNERLLGVLSTKENVNLATLGFESTDVRRFQAIITPIEIAGERLGTLLTPEQCRDGARKQWLAGHLQTRGTLTLDAGATKALTDDHKSLLSVGVTAVQGNFLRGEMVVCVDDQGVEVARGLSNYSSAEATKIIGLCSESIVETLGYMAEAELIHRDNLVIL